MLSLFLCAHSLTLPPSPTLLLQESQAQRSNHTQPNNRPARLNNLLIRQRPAGIPHQMPEAIKAVEGERKCEERLQANLDQDGQCSETGRQARGFKVPAERRGDEVGGAEGIDGTGEDAACDTIQGRQVPGYLWAVDGEVRADGADAPLRCEDLLALCLRDGRGGCLSVW